MAGDFIPDPDSTSSPITDELPSTSVPTSDLLRSLTPRQGDRLLTHLDDRLLSLERDERKHAFGSLRALLARLLPLLHLILQIPPLEPWSPLRTSYLLTFTGSVPAYITSLPLFSLSMSELEMERNDERRAARTMRVLLDFLAEVDRGWMSVLRGDGWLPPSESGGRGRTVKVDYGGSVGATERIRLRSIIIAGREKMLAWAWTYGDFRGSSFPEGDGEVDDGEVEEDDREGREWEGEITGMWNRTLEMLADHDFGDDSYA